MCPFVIIVLTMFPHASVHVTYTGQTKTIKKKGYPLLNNELQDSLADDDFCSEFDP